MLPHWKGIEFELLGGVPISAPLGQKAPQGLTFWDACLSNACLLRRFRDMNGLEKGGRVDHLHRRYHIKTLNVRYEHHCGTDHGGHHEMQRVQRENKKLYSECAHLTLKSEYRINSLGQGSFLTCELHIFATLPLSSHFKQTFNRPMATRSNGLDYHTLSQKAHVSKDNNGQKHSETTEQTES